MKISVSIRKTVQEDPYEPFSVELSLEKTIPDETKEKRVQAEQEALALILQETIDNIFEERMKK